MEDVLMGWSYGPRDRGGDLLPGDRGGVLPSPPPYPETSPGAAQAIIGMKRGAKNRVLLKYVLVGIFCVFLCFKSQKAVGVAVCPINQHTTQCLY